MAGVFSPTIASVPGLASRIRQNFEAREKVLNQPYPVSVIVASENREQAEQVSLLITSYLQTGGFEHVAHKKAGGSDLLRYDREADEHLSPASVLDSIAQFDPDLFKQRVQVFAVTGKVERDRDAVTPDERDIAHKVAEYVSENMYDLIKQGIEDVTDPLSKQFAPKTLLSEGVVLVKERNE